MSDIRERVSEDYTKALKRAQAGEVGCCSQAATTAGYGTEAGAYEEASGTSFGCGNPLAFSGVEAGQTVLDLGSGAGLDLLLASNLVGSQGRVIGIDMTDDMIAAARANIEKANKSNVEVRKGFIEALPVDDASVDWVISNCVINLSPEKSIVFREIARVLKPGGRISISDIVAEDLPAEVRESASAHSACVAGAIPEAEYLEGLRAAGLEEVDVTERIVYDADQISGMVEGELPELSSCCGGSTADTLAGKVWSARVVGRKSTK